MSAQCSECQSDEISNQCGSAAGATMILRWAECARYCCFCCRSGDVLAPAGGAVAVTVAVAIARLESFVKDRIHIWS